MYSLLMELGFFEGHEGNKGTAERVNPYEQDER
jgi:hypothetical protein